MGVTAYCILGLSVLLGPSQKALVRGKATRESQINVFTRDDPSHQTCMRLFLQHVFRIHFYAGVSAILATMQLMRSTTINRIQFNTTCPAIKVRIL